jgi:Uma2 family endonuclease
MTAAKSPQFTSFEAYLSTDPSDLPEGRYEYWDGELVELMTESLFNNGVANRLMLLLVAAGIPWDLIQPHCCEIEVKGRPRTRIPDLVVLEDIHLTLMAKRATLTTKMPPPALLVEVVSPGSESSTNYKRDYEDKAQQYAAINVLEYWLIDPDRAVVLVGTLVDGKYQFEVFRGDALIISPTFPSLNLTAAAVLMAKR